MRPATLALTVGGALVALGGIYLFLEVRHAAPVPTAEAALAEARRAPEPAPSRATPPSAAARPERPRSRPATAEVLRKPQRMAIADDPPARPVLAQAEMSVETSDHLLEANKLYDRGDFDGARGLALKLLGDAPGNVKLLRVVVSSSCILGDADVANQYVGQLPERDQAQMADRCSKYQIELKPNPAAKTGLTKGQIDRKGQ